MQCVIPHPVQTEEWEVWFSVAWFDNGRIWLIPRFGFDTACIFILSRKLAALRGQNKADLRATCPQKSVRALQILRHMLADFSLWYMKKRWGPLKIFILGPNCPRNCLAYFNLWELEIPNLMFVNLEAFTKWDSWNKPSWIRFRSHTKTVHFKTELIQTYFCARQQQKR